MVASASRKSADLFTGLRKGMLEFLLLRMIGAEKMYVADISKRLASTPFKAPHGTLYPLLGKMRRDGLLDHEWKESRGGPPRKYYTLTKQGAQRLDALTQYWKTMTAAIGDIAR